MKQSFTPAQFHSVRCGLLRHLKCFSSPWLVKHRCLPCVQPASRPHQQQVCMSISTAANTTSTTSHSQPSTGVGFIGLGNMGFPMVQNLARSPAAANFKEILVFDLHAEACERAASINELQVVNNIEEMSKQALIITMLPGDAALNDVMQTLHARWLDEQQQQQHSQPHGQQHQRVVIDCSTVSPSTSIQWSKTLLEGGSATFFDAPVSGGVKGATDGTLTFMLGGCSFLSRGERTTPDETSSTSGVGGGILDVKFILEQMGSRVMECGPHVGAGTATKLCNNLALAAQMIGICEALHLGETLGVDPMVLSSVLNSSTAACWSSKVNNPHPKVAMTTGAPASRNYEGGFATNLMLKDLGLALKVASEHNVSLPLTSTSKELYQLSALQGRGSYDFGSVIQMLRGENDKTE